jgi:hypothetical protein
MQHSSPVSFIVVQTVRKLIYEAKISAQSTIPDRDVVTIDYIICEVPGSELYKSIVHTIQRLGVRSAQCEPPLTKHEDDRTGVLLVESVFCDLQLVTSLTVANRDECGMKKKSWLKRTI